MDVRVDKPQFCAGLILYADLQPLRVAVVLAGAHPLGH